MSYFFDECLSFRFVGMLRALDEEVVHISEAGTYGIQLGDKDPEWLPKVAEHGLILVTHDTRIRRKPEERELLQGLAIRAVFITGARGRGRAGGVEDGLRGDGASADAGANARSPWFGLSAASKFDG